MSKKMGAKGKYHKWLESENLAQIQAWKRDGLTDEQIAENMGIVKSTFYDWVNKYSDISDALKRGQEQMIAHVENAIFRRAIGYEYVERKVKVTEKADGTNEVVKEQHTKEVVPDVGAQIFILKNRSNGKWRDKREYDLSADSANKLDEVLAKLDETIFEEDEDE